MLSKNTSFPWSLTKVLMADSKFMCACFQMTVVRMIGLSLKKNRPETGVFWLKSKDFDEIPRFQNLKVRMSKFESADFQVNLRISRKSTVISSTAKHRNERPLAQKGNPLYLHFCQIPCINRMYCVT